MNPLACLSRPCCRPSARVVYYSGYSDEGCAQCRESILTGPNSAQWDFPKGLARTKPYSYSIFNFDNMAMLCQSLQRDGADLFVFAVRNGRDICKGAGAACHWPALPARRLTGAMDFPEPGSIRSGDHPQTIQCAPQPLMWFPA